MSRVLEGVSGIVRVTRTPLSIVAIAIVMPMTFSAVIFLFAPLPLVVKCVVGGLPLGFTLLVWIQFWSKAKTEPLSASEEYYIQELRYRYPGVEDSRLSVEQIEALRRIRSAEVSQATQSDDEGESQS